MFRSTKGASKQRRDLINSEIGNLRDMLPLPESARQRLSQLQIMSLACCYIRKCNYFARLFGNPGFGGEPPFEFSQAITGFLLISTREGKLLYISENVTEYLGHSMVDMMTQGDSIYDIVDKRDHTTVQQQLLQTNYNPDNEDERTFFCRMNVARSFRRQAGFGDHKVMHIRGHFIQPLIRDHYGNQPVFMAVCSPLITPDVKETSVQQNTMVYQSIHGLDMKFIELAQNGEHHLGYSDTEIQGRSWYEILHPEDIDEAREKHVQLIKSSHEMGCMLTVRLQTNSGDWVWVNTVMHIRQPYACDGGDPAIVCINQIITENEAQHFKMQSQLFSSHIARSPEFLDPQGGSPSHPITPVAVEREQLQLPYGIEKEEDTTACYHGAFDIVPASSVMPGNGGMGLGGSGEGMPSNGSQPEYSVGGSPTQHQARLSPKEQKQILRAGILNRLKRKMADMANQQCKPPKMMRYQRSDNPEDANPGGGITIMGSALIAPSNMTYEAPAQFQGSGFGPVLGAVSQGPVFAQLSLKKKSDILGILEQPAAVRVLEQPTAVTISPKAKRVEYSQPLTPESDTSSTVDASELTSQGLTTLTVDVTDAALVPPSILTPESSPSSSPITKDTMFSQTDSQEEQLVPSLLNDLEETSIFMDLGGDLPIRKPKEEVKMITDRIPPPSSKLPELDILSLEKYLASVEGTDSLLAPQVLEMEDVTMDCSPPSVSSVASSEVSSVPSPRVPSSESCNMEQNRLDISPSELLRMDDDDLQSLVMTVTDTILDMVQNSQSCPLSSNLSRDLMAIQNRQAYGNRSIDDHQAEVPSLEGDLDELQSSDNEDLLNELHQLNQLAGSKPSYGEESLAGVLFDKTL